MENYRKSSILIHIFCILIIANIFLIPCYAISEKSTVQNSNAQLSSKISVNDNRNLGVVVLTNSNNIFSKRTKSVELSIENEDTQEQGDMVTIINNISTVVICIMLIFSITVIIFIVLCILYVIKNKIKASLPPKKIIQILLFTTIFILTIGYSLYYVPDVFFNGASWDEINVWAPISLFIAVLSILISCAVFCIYAVLLLIYKELNKKAYFALVVVGIVSGFVNAFILFTINEAISGRRASLNGIYIFFIMGMMLYAYSYKYLRTKLIQMTNDLVYDKRMTLINKILAAPYNKFENVDKGKLFATLSNDMDILSNTINILVGAVTNIVTLLCCFVYLGIINLIGLVASVVIMLIGGSIYYLVSFKAKKHLEENRKTQNTFYNIIRSMIDGFKELRISFSKRSEFKSDMEKSCETFRKTNVIANQKFANAFIIGDLLTFFVIGGVAFIFPIIFKNLSINALRDYIFIYLYMTGPVRYILNLAPELFNIKISWNRVNDVLESMSDMNSSKKITNQSLPKFKHENINLKLEGVYYNYKIENETVFTVGPIDYEFNSGELIFIAGGNGSGKSTLAKILTGLYVPDSGVISINEKTIDSKILGENYSTVYSDFYLFNKLYGIDYKNKQQEISECLKLFKLNHKVDIKDGEFTTTKLSTGQRKRLALLLSYLEDRPICLFDEWAADQDPEFRKYFYLTLLPELKARGKCIIAITHDDRYYYMADKFIKMEMGKIVEVKEIDENISQTILDA